MRLIDADKLIPKLNFIQEAEKQVYGRGTWNFVGKCINAIEDAPTIEEQKTGKWVHAYDCDCFQCNQCGTPSIVAQPYCCICGAKMEVQE